MYVFVCLDGGGGQGLLLVGCMLHSVVMGKEWKVLWGSARGTGCGWSLILQKSSALRALPYVLDPIPYTHFSVLDTPCLATWHRDLVCLAVPTAVE